MSVDHMQIASLLSSDKNDPFNRYSNYENVYIPDTNNNQYNGTLQYDTMLQQANWIDYGSSSLEIPLIIALPKRFGVGNDEYPGTDDVGLAFKNNVANLITGVNLEINGVQILNTNQINILNHINTMYDSSNDWSESSGQQYGFFKDTTNTTDVAKNTGLKSRIEFLKPHYVYLGNKVTSIQLMVSIPLREISVFFETLTYPLYNCRLRLQFTLSNTASASVPTGIQNCFVVSSGVAARYADFNWILRSTHPSTDAEKEKGYIVIGSGIVSKSGSSRSGTNLVVPKITHGPEASQQLNESLMKGNFVKKNTWVDQKVFYHSEQHDLGALGTEKDISFNITPGIKKPSRVYCVVFDANKNAAGYSSICSQLSVAPCATSSAGLRACNLEINNTPMFNPMLNTDVDFYNLVKKETPSATQDYTTGSLISYNDFVTVNDRNANLDGKFGCHKYYCFNLGRLYASGQLTDTPTAIRFTGKLYNNVGDNALVDVFFIIETEASTEINFSNSKVVSLGQAV